MTPRFLLRRVRIILQNGSPRSDDQTVEGVAYVDVNKLCDSEISLESVENIDLRPFSTSWNDSPYLGFQTRNRGERNGSTLLETLNCEQLGPEESKTETKLDWRNEIKARRKSGLGWPRIAVRNRVNRSYPTIGRTESCF